MPRYTIRNNRIKSGCVTGFNVDDKGHFILKTDEMYHGIFFKSFDQGVGQASWGRLSFNESCSENMIYYVYVLALDERSIMTEGQEADLDAVLTDPLTDVPEKIALLKRLGAKRFVRCSDCLLYEMYGRYMYVAFEAAGEEEFSISGIALDTEGDNFMATYPEIYRERGSFLHRYLSVFSSIYNDFGRDIADLPKLLDLDSCPKELLIIYGGWMGIDLKGEFLEEKVLRTLVKEAYSLNRIKGTKKAIERLLEIILGEKAIVIEHNEVKGAAREDAFIPENLRSKGIYDVTILVKKHLTEELRHQIIFILDQFKPVRTRINLTQLDKTPTVDSNTYLDVNFRLPDAKQAVLDEESTLDGTMILK